MLFIQELLAHVLPGLQAILCSKKALFWRLASNAALNAFISATLARQPGCRVKAIADKSSKAVRNFAEIGLKRMFRRLSPNVEQLLMLQNQELHALYLCGLDGNLILEAAIHAGG